MRSYHDDFSDLSDDDRTRGPHTDAAATAWVVAALIGIAGVLGAVTLIIWWCQ